MSSISFDNVYYFFLAIPLVVLFVLPFALAIRKGNANRHNVTSLVLHVVLAFLLAFAATAPTVTVSFTRTEVYVVADVSYSARKNLDTVDGYIRSLELPQNSKIGLVAFGKDCELVSKLGRKSRLASVKKANVDISGTDIVGALEYTAGLFGRNVIKRIVLITDGRDSDTSDDYALKNAVDKLQMQNIRVDAIYLDGSIPAGSEEVQISRVEYTQNAYLGALESATAVIRSGTESDAIVSLFLGTEMISRRTVKLTEGVNNVVFDLDTSEEGTFDYSVTVEADKDTSDINNKCSFTQTVTEEIRVLFIAGSWEECTTAVDRYGEKAVLDIYEDDDTVSAFAKNKYITQHADNTNLTIHRSSRAVPFSVEALCYYDEIVLSNTDIMELNNYTEFVRNLDTVVSAYGKSFITLGNLGIQNREYSELKQLEDMLPVRFGNNENDPRIYTLVIDASRSMENLSHLIVAKQVSNALVKLLNDDDEICVVTFYSDVRIIQPPKPVGDFGSGEINKLIDGIFATQGTLIGRGLQSAYEFMRDLQYSDKQVMLLTDGLTYSDEPDDPVEVAKAMYESGIVTSVFDVGRMGDAQDGSESNPDEVSAAAKQMLKKVAEEGHGNYYYSNNLENMDEVTFGKMADAMTDSVVNRDTSVTIERRTDPVLSGIITDGEGNIVPLPDISGYVYGSAKSSASTALSVKHERAGGTVDKPLYTYWKYGNGRVACFTGDFCGDRLKHWNDEGITEAFYNNILSTNIPSYSHTTPFNLSLTEEGKMMVVELTPETARFGANARIEVTLPDGSVESREMSFYASYYLGKVDISEVGRYEFCIIYNYNTVEYAYNAIVYNDYPEEYDEFAVYDSATLHRAIDGRGTVSTDGALDLSYDMSEVGRYIYDLAPILFTICAVLFLVDVVVRKLRWDDVKSFFAPNKAKGDKKQ